MRRSKPITAVFPRRLREDAATADCSEVRVLKSDVTIRRDAWRCSSLAAGPHGVYRLHLGILTPVVSFENIEQLVTDGDDLLHWEWQPQRLVAIGEGRYVIAGAQGGVYVVTLLPGNRASLRAVDDRLGAPLTM